MRPPALLPLLPLLLAPLLAAAPRDDTSPPSDFNITSLADTGDRDNVTALPSGALTNGTVSELGDGEHEPVVRKKRTFGDIVFRGLADVLGYNVQRKPNQAPFPPPLAPVPGIDTPLQAGPAPAPVPAPAPAPAAPAPPPCGAPRAAPAAPPPCRAQAPPPPPPPPPRPPPCPRPRAAPRPRPRPRPTTPPPPPPPPTPPPPPCARPRANPATPAPCAPAPAAPPPPSKDADSNLETITSNFQLNFNINRRPAAIANPAPPAQAQDRADSFDQELEQNEEQNEVQNEVQPEAPIVIQPRAARLPPPQPREPRVYVDAFLVRDGVTQRAVAVDAARFDPHRAALDDYLDDEAPQQDADDDYEDVQESRDRAKAVREFGSAVDRFWENKKHQPKRAQLPADDYRRVHFGDRDLNEGIIRRGDRASHQNLQRARARPNAVTSPQPEPEEEDESTTTTEDPRRPLKPRILPPTEQNPAQIDTVTVRVPPIYREKRPKKLHRERPERPERDEEEGGRDSGEHTGYEGSEEYQGRGDSDGEHSAPARRRRRKPRRRVQRSADDAAEDFYTAGDYDYFGNKLPISKEEETFRSLTIPPPTIDEDLARLEGAPESGHFLDDHERLRDEPAPLESGRRDAELADESERSGEAERGDESERAGEGERTDRLGPNARVREAGYENRYLHATKVHVDEDKFTPTPATTATAAPASARARPRARAS